MSAPLPEGCGTIGGHEMRTIGFRQIVAVLALGALLLSGLAANAQLMAQESKKTMSHTSTQSQLAYQKMDHVAEGAVQDAAQNRLAVTKKVQARTASKKMTQSGKGNASGQGTSGTHDRSGGNG